MALSGRKIDGSVITPELLDELLANYEKPEDLTTEHGLFKQLKKAPIERALGWCSVAAFLLVARSQRVAVRNVTGRGSQPRSISDGMAERRRPVDTMRMPSRAELRSVAEGYERSARSNASPSQSSTWMRGNAKTSDVAVTGPCLVEHA